jgi:hypothetical protein
MLLSVSDGEFLVEHLTLVVCKAMDIYFGVSFYYLVSTTKNTFKLLFRTLAVLSESGSMREVHALVLNRKVQQCALK